MRHAACAKPRHHDKLPCQFCFLLHLQDTLLHGFSDMAKTLADVQTALSGLTTAVATLKSDSDKAKADLLAAQATIASDQTQIADLTAKLADAVANAEDPAVIQSLLDQIASLRATLGLPPTVAELKLRGDPVVLKNGQEAFLNGLGADFNVGVDSTIDLGCKAVDGDGVEIVGAVITYSVDKSAALVDANGVVTGKLSSLSEGLVTFTATDGASSISFKLWIGVA